VASEHVCCGCHDEAYNAGVLAGRRERDFENAALLEHRAVLQADLKAAEAECAKLRAELAEAARVHEATLKLAQHANDELIEAEAELSKLREDRDRLAGLVEEAVAWHEGSHQIALAPSCGLCVTFAKLEAK